MSKRFRLWLAEQLVYAVAHLIWGDAHGAEFGWHSNDEGCIHKVTLNVDPHFKYPELAQ